ncbi:MAG: MBL fold metallo-hydrolase [Candidatus Diapherotrites archaeon]|nr:MBL fold metallo-hydrolase [Candidatus Diapherotrites archaeon]
MDYQGTEIQRFKHATIFLKNKKGLIVYIDPYLTDTRMEKADIVICTHEHFDHYSPEDIFKISKKETILIGPEGVCKKTKDRNAKILRVGETIEVLGIKITGTEMYNIDKFRLPGVPFHPKGLGIGIIVEMDGVKVYHAGDTDFIPEMKNLKVNIACLPVSGTFVMTWQEAVHAAEAIQADLTIPIHYGDGVIGTKEDAENFKKYYKGKTEILK